MRVLQIAISSFFLFFALNAQNITNVDLIQAKFGIIPASTIFEDIRYIPLETHEGGLLNIKFASYYLTDNYNDTVFRVDEKNMTPHIIFNLGNKQPSYYHQNDMEFNKGKYRIDFNNFHIPFIV